MWNSLLPLHVTSMLMWTFLIMCLCCVSYLRRQSVSVVAPVVWLSPLSADPSPPGLRGQNGVEEPGRSRLMSQNGSIVVETPLEGQRTEKYDECLWDYKNAPVFIQFLTVINKVEGCCVSVSYQFWRRYTNTRHFLVVSRKSQRRETEKIVAPTQSRRHGLDRVGN